MINYQKQQHCCRICYLPKFFNLQLELLLTSLWVNKTHPAPQLQLQTCHMLQPVLRPWGHSLPSRKLHICGKTGSFGWQLDVSLPPGSREKGHPGRASKSNGNNRTESRGTHPDTSTPSTKSSAPTRSQTPQGRQSECFHHPLLHSLLQQFPTFPLKPSSAPPA